MIEFNMIHMIHMIESTLDYAPHSQPFLQRSRKILADKGLQLLPTPLWKRCSWRGTSAQKQYQPVTTCRLAKSRRSKLSLLQTTDIEKSYDVLFSGAPR
jgi:hypothetical protein